MWAAFYQEISETLIEQYRLKYKCVTVRIAVSSQMSIKQIPHAGTGLTVMRDARDIPTGILALGSCVAIEHRWLGQKILHLGGSEDPELFLWILFNLPPSSLNFEYLYQEV